MFLEYGVAVAAVANGWSGYFPNALTAVGLKLPEYLPAGPMQGVTLNLPAFLIVLLIAGLTTVMFVMFCGMARVLLAMSRDGLLPFGVWIVIGVIVYGTYSIRHSALNSVAEYRGEQG